MKELLRTNDPVLISYIEASLGRVGIQVLVFDTNASILDGSVGILPRRLTVLDEDFEAAVKILEDAGLSHELGQNI